jgi:uncharacterized protein
MSKTDANVITPQASRLLRRLCKHWSHRFEVTFDDMHGVIDFGTSQCELTASGTHLLVNVTLSENENVEQMEEVIADHLKRVGGDDALIIEWHRSA